MLTSNLLVQCIFCIYIFSCKYLLLLDPCLFPGLLQIENFFKKIVHEQKCFITTQNVNIYKQTCKYIIIIYNKFYKLLDKSKAISSKILAIKNVNEKSTMGT